MNTIKENILIENIVRSFPRSVLQLNTVHESDAELIRIPGTDIIIALTTDSICEEIERGLYSDPYMIGSMLVTINMSDLAAVGSTPIGILLNLTLTHQTGEAFLSELNRGIADACIQYSTAILGGDTNYSSRLQVGATAVGYVSTSKTLSRKGCKAGDLLFASGRLGNGNAFAFRKLTGGIEEIDFHPIARNREGVIIRQFASSCIDTSDGMIAAMDQLKRVNSVGINITIPCNEMLTSSALKLCKEHSLPEWYMLAGPHGEFELLFAVPPSAVEEFLDQARTIQWQPVALGTFTERQDIILLYHDESTVFDTGRIRNICFGDHTDISYFLSEFNTIEQSLRGAKQ